MQIIATEANFTVGWPQHEMVFILAKKQETKESSDFRYFSSHDYSAQLQSASGSLEQRSPLEFQQRDERSGNEKLKQNNLYLLATLSNPGKKAMSLSSG